MNSEPGPSTSRATQAFALQRTVGNAATRRLLSGHLQRKLPKGLAPTTRVVHHEEAGDVTGYTIVKTVIGTYTIKGPDAKEYKNISTGNADWGTEEGQAASRLEWERVRAERAAGEAAETLRKQLIVGENYLSADYRRINPLLAALEKNGYTSPQVRDKAFDYSAKKLLILADMKAIAVSRNYTDQDASSTRRSPRTGTGRGTTT